MSSFIIVAWRRVQGLILLIGLGLATGVDAAGVMTQGQWLIRHTALPTTVLQPDIAGQYGIQRAHNRAFINLSVHDQTRAGIGAVPADVSGQFVNLLGQTETLDFRPVREGDALYYIAEFRFPHREALRFELQVKPRAADAPVSLEFRQTIYAEDRP